MDRDFFTWLAGAALTATAALAFSQVFSSAAFVPVVVVAAFGPFVVGFGIRRTVLATLLSVATAAVFVLVGVYGWMPTQGWLDMSAFVSLVDDGASTARSAIPPVDVTDGILVLLAVGVWACGIAVELCLRRHNVVGALVAPLAVFVVATVLGRGNGSVGAALGFAVAAVVLLFVEHRSVVKSRRGSVVGRRRSRDARTTPRPQFAVAVVVGAIAVVLGVGIAPFLPGADAGAIVDFEGFGDRASTVYEPGISPVLDVGARLTQGPRSEVFRVRADHPAYWRLVALDVYEDTWTLDAPSEAIGTGLDEDAAAPFRQEFTITGALGERWMPAAFEAKRVAPDDVLVVRDSATLVTTAASTAGLAYTVESELPVTSVPPELAATSAQRVPDDLTGLVELPQDFSGSITAAAIDATSGATNPYQRAVALQRFFRDPSFVYDPDIRYGESGLEDGERVIEQFLIDRRGFCVQFAAAYAVMARAVGIPSRIAIGYTPGTRVGDEFVVTNEEAHAWPEVWLGDEIGWTGAFDPTPPSPLPGGSALPEEIPPEEAPTPPTTPAPVPTTVPAPPNGTVPVPDIEIAAPETIASDGTPWALRAVALVVLGALGVAVWVLGIVLTKRRRRRERRDGEPTAAVTGAWFEALDRLDEARIAVPSTATPRELAHALGTTDPIAGSALADLAGTYGAARYGPGALEADAQQAWHRVEVFEGALMADVGVRTRWLRRLRSVDRR